MGTITVTRDQLVNDLNNQLPLVAHFAGATSPKISYDAANELLTVNGVLDADLQDAVDNFQTYLSAWHVGNVSLDAERSRAKTKIDKHAGIARTRYITVAPGQGLTYQEKAEEAADYIAAGYPAPTGSPPMLEDYPFLQAEVDATGKTHAQAADDILNQKSAWIAAGAQIEKHRLGGKAQVDNATTDEDIRAITEATIALLDAV